MDLDHSFEVIYPRQAGVDSVSLGGSAGVNIPAGPTASRTSAPVSGSTRVNTDNSVLEYFAGTWKQPIVSVVAGSGISASVLNGNLTISASGGTVSSVGLSLPSIFSVAGSPITTSGTISATLVAQPINTILAGPTFGPAAVPSFRTLGLATNDINDVTVTSATLGQVLAYNGTRWVNTGAVGSNAAGLIGVGQAGGAAWALVSGSYYEATFTHNLSTLNVVVTVFDTSNNAIVIPDSVILTNSNSVKIRVYGNTRTLRVVVVANGQSLVAGGSTPSSVITAKDGVNVSAAATRLNFSGQAVSVSDAGGGTTNIHVGARYSYFANSLDTPNNSDFAISALAPVVTDPAFNSLNVRSFSNSVEQGVAFTCAIPSGATSVTFKIKGRAAVSQATSTVVQPRLYTRLIPNNSAVAAWSTANELANLSIPANAFFQYFQQTIPLSSLGLVSDRLYQFELSRRVAGVTGTNSPTAFLLAEVTLEFS